MSVCLCASAATVKPMWAVLHFVFLFLAIISSMNILPIDFSHIVSQACTVAWNMSSLDLPGEGVCVRNLTPGTV